MDTAPAPKTDHTAKLAGFLAGLDYDAIPAHVVERAKDLVLDHAGVALHGLDLPWSRIISEYAEAEGGSGASTLYGRGRIAARMAALGNGTLAHAIELDDTHDESLSHPGAVVIPAALAVAEARGASGRELIAAIVAGYEAQCRAGAAATRNLMLRGFHPTATAGVFGACAAAARLMRLDADTLQSAWGLAVSMSSGVTQFTEDAAGTMVKRLHAGMPAHNGVMAAELAARGFRGPRQALDGKSGFTHVIGAEPDDARITRALGEAWEIERVSIKLYACCRMFHALIDAIGEARADASWTPAEVEEVEAFGPCLMVEGHMQYRPESVMSAQYSLPYTVAASLLLDPRDPRSFDEQAMKRPDVLALADRVQGRVDQVFDSRFPARCGGRARFSLKGGRVVERALDDSRGTPAKPVDRSGIEAKFRALTGGMLASRRQDAIVEAAFGLDRAAGVAPLAKLLGAQ